MEKIVPKKGMWLYNSKNRVITDSVYLAIHGKKKDWIEIDTDEKNRLEKEWEKEIEVDNNESIYEKAKAYDIIVGKEQ